VGGEKLATMSLCGTRGLWCHEGLVRKSRDMEGNRNGMQWWIDVRSNSPSSLKEEEGVQEAHMTEEGRMGWFEGERQERAAGCRLYKCCLVADAGTLYRGRDILSRVRILLATWCCLQEEDGLRALELCRRCGYNYTIEADGGFSTKARLSSKLALTRANHIKRTSWLRM
jgi:hypothetical protein